MKRKWLLGQSQQLSDLGKYCIESPHKVIASLRPIESSNVKVPMKEPRLGLDWERSLQTLSTILNKKVV